MGNAEGSGTQRGFRNAYPSNHSRPIRRILRRGVDLWNYHLVPKARQEVRPPPHGPETIRPSRVGALAEKLAVDGGGLAIEFQPSRDNRARRIIFGFGELAIWVSSDEPTSEPTTIRDALTRSRCESRP